MRRNERELSHMCMKLRMTKEEWQKFCTRLITQIPVGFADGWMDPRLLIKSLLIQYFVRRI